jgi:hypothetical protein
MEKDMIMLNPLFQCASRIFAVIIAQGDAVPLNNLYNLYVVKWGNPLNTTAFGHSSVTSLLNAVPEIFEVSGKANKRLVSIHQFLQGKFLYCSSLTFLSLYFPRLKKKYKSIRGQKRRSYFPEQQCDSDETSLGSQR